MRLKTGLTCTADRSQGVCAVPSNLNAPRGCVSSEETVEIELHGVMEGGMNAVKLSEGCSEEGTLSGGLGGVSGAETHPDPLRGAMAVLDVPPPS